MLKVGQKFTLTNNAIANYGEKYRGKAFTVSHVATNADQHRGYDESMQGMALYDAEELNFSVYEYEIKKKY
jgi:hypothetical protein